MSTVYYVVNLDVKRYIEFMGPEITANCALFLQKMEESFAKAPAGDQTGELQDFLRRTLSAHMEKVSSGGCLPGVLNESMALGTETPQKFYWRRDNFQSVEAVEAYLQAHPSCVIFDDEQTQVPLERFREIATK